MFQFSNFSKKSNFGKGTYILTIHLIFENNSLIFFKEFDQAKFNILFKELFENPQVYRINEKKYLDKISANNEEMMLSLIVVGDLLMLDSNFPSGSRVLGLKFLKSAMDIKNKKFSGFFQIHALDTFHQIALLSNNPRCFFNENPGSTPFFLILIDLFICLGSEDEKNGIFFVNMVLECLVNWAEWFRGDYKSHLEELKKHGVVFPTVWKHFLDFNFIRKLNSSNFLD